MNGPVLVLQFAQEDLGVQKSIYTFNRTLKEKDQIILEKAHRWLAILELNNVINDQLCRMNRVLQH